ncbi:bifunctional 3-(3-hydroxy-phenyl)propionate/3-hydroxycinnamic acid hydroxylase MhpA [Mycolicibacterium brisbanense]|uniref:2-polyprenyl-6-methoxyphenol hydroxylase-like oxidoreductase n=1 Tax=Mycolicibacterium brisbanense TaxID=146020 RepID=A0A117I5E5_9MYCO|nr:bifunctional 3-(3-hydroxy-phenyl)propionate/3-hydroxycinnamic acid hydroxylase [Mycolicibacterium brisbanense]MCV7161986.1 bifunctional 3-(3-hydroxy-phenyl)propionate/3-hydroxycinnamic acid hydroxylase [Mycolicibacterium brisbanense]GAS88395.1 2-polyprenyl-6-methoxyphenol hydroxylase-like oxidoreductase [Mycolicibacterium brisbanense]
MKTPSHYPVVVIGAGPTGVTAATLLAQYGVDALLLDRWPDVYPQPRAVHLDDEIYRVIDRLGLAEGFAAISRPALGLRLLDDDQQVLSEFRRDPDHSPNGFPQANMFDQPEFETLLRDNLSRYPRTRLWGGAEVVDIEPGTPTRISLVDRGKKHILTADYVLGCDGANSLVRKRIGTSMRDLHFEQRWLVVDIATTADLHQWEGVHQVCSTRRAGTYMRIGTTRYRWEFRLLPGESAADFSTVSALRPLIAPWTAHVDEDQLELVRITEYTFRARVADRWRRGNIFLLGDAAHLTPPFIGQGMGAGLRDAVNLTWKLAGVLHGDLDATVLDTYERERKPHARSMIRLALKVGRAMTAGGRTGSLARRVVLPRLHLVPGLRDKVLDSRTPSLRLPGPGKLAGRLCPNPGLDDGTRLDTRLGRGFSVVSLRALTDAESAHVAACGATAYVDSVGAVAEWLRRGNAVAAVVRPDRTVACSGRDVAAVLDALPAFHPPHIRAADRSTVPGHVPDTPARRSRRR